MSGKDRNSKRRQGEETAALGQQADTIPLDTTCPIPTASLNISLYPYIFSLILDNSTSGTQATLLRCSKTTFEAVAPHLYRSLRVTPAQLATMVETGWEPKKRGITAGILGRSFSPYLREALSHVRTLHLINYSREVSLPQLPRGCMAAVHSVVLHCNGYLGRKWAPALPRLLRSVGVVDLYIRLSYNYIVRTRWQEVRDTETIAVKLPPLPRSVRAVTLLVAQAYLLDCAPSCGLHAADVGRGIIVTVVLLPWQPTDRNMAQQAGMVSRWTSNQSGLAVDSVRHLVRLVGAEYTGVRYIRGRKNLDLIPALPQGGPAGSSGRQLLFLTFDLWLGSLQPGLLFTPWEHAGIYLAHMLLGARMMEDRLKKLRVMYEEVTQAGGTVQMGLCDLNTLEADVRSAHASVKSIEAMLPFGNLEEILVERVI